MMYCYVLLRTKGNRRESNKCNNLWLTICSEPYIQCIYIVLNKERQIKPPCNIHHLRTTVFQSNSCDMIYSLNIKAFPCWMTLMECKWGQLFLHKIVFWNIFFLSNCYAWVGSFLFYLHNQLHHESWSLLVIYTFILLVW